MKNVIVYGKGCKNCTLTEERIQDFAREIGLDIQIRKETDLMEIMNAGVMSTPGVSVNGKIVHTGSVPTTSDIEAFLKVPEETCSCGGNC